MAEDGPKFQMGRFTGVMIELIEDSDFDKIELNKGDFVVVFNAEDFKEWHDGLLERVKQIKCCPKIRD